MNKIASTLAILGFTCLGTACSDSKSSSSSSDVKCTAAGAPVAAPYKGIFAPSLFSGLQSIDTPESVKALNGNLMSIVFAAKVTSKGTFTVDSDWADLGPQIDAFHAGGVGVVLALESQMEDGSAESPTMDSSLVESEAFQENLTALSVELAGVAEKCAVEIFIPYNEADLKMGAAAAGAWGQTVLSQVRAAYPTGKVMWKLASSANAAAVDVTGYDMAGISLSPAGTDSTSLFAARVVSEVNTAKTAFAAKGVTSVWITEFGIWGDFDSGKTDSELASFMTAGFDQMNSLGLSGVMVLDGPEGYDPQLNGTTLGTTTASFFSTFGQ